jgi:methylated-DNA-[protein]-cysteine S-methyltransferase
LSSYLLVESGFGVVGVVWGQTERGPSVFRVYLPQPAVPAEQCIQEAFPGAVPRSSPSVAQLAGRIQRFLDGEAVNFDMDSIALDRCSDFQASVLRAEHRIPRGWVSTYGRVANHLAIPGGARAVGQALARNPFPIIIPCHRAIGAKGRLGGFQGGAAMKRELLELEGVEFSSSGRVLIQRYYY